MTSYKLAVHLDTETEIKAGYLEKTGTSTLDIGKLTLFITGSPTQRLYIAQQLRKVCDEVADQARAAAEAPGAPHPVVDDPINIARRKFSRGPAESWRQFSSGEGD